MTFEEYLTSKKIDGRLFKQGEPDLFAEWANLFSAMNPASFTAQKLYLINPTRRKYLLKEELVDKPKLASSVGKPVMRPKPKMN